MRQTMTIVVLAALVLCSACTQQSKTATFITPTAQSLKWDEAVAASTTVKVGNSNLISMR